MAYISNPTKQQVRDYIANRVKSHTPIPSADDIKRALGWHLLQPVPNRRGS